MTDGGTVTRPAAVRGFGWTAMICAHSHRWMSEEKSTRCPVCGTTTIRKDDRIYA